MGVDQADDSRSGKIWKPKMIHLNQHQLSMYDGRNPNQPIYLSISSKLYDVSSSERIYGPGGSYSMLSVFVFALKALFGFIRLFVMFFRFFSLSCRAGRDASRAFITGCFQEHHLTHDLRGIEPSQLPVRLFFLPPSPFLPR